MSTQKLEELVNRLEKVAQKLEGGKSAPTTSSSSSQEESEQCVAYIQYLSSFVDPFLASCKTIGGDVATLAVDIKSAFDELKNIIHVASLSKKPSDTEFGKMLAPIVALTKKISDFAKAKKGTDSFNHLSTVGEGIGMVLWPAMGTTPKGYVDEMTNASQFYSNKILMQYKNSGDSGKVHVEFVQQFKAIGSELALYVKEHHTTGLKWNPQGGDASSVQAKPTGTTSAPKSGGAPPPPVMTKEQKEKLEAEQKKGFSTAPKEEAGALFAQLNAIGSGETKLALKHVQNHEKTKNRSAEERVSTVGEIKAKVVKKSRITGKPLCELSSSKWMVENNEGNKDLVVEITSTKEAVYIHMCDNCNITIKGKFNSVTMDNCVKTNLIFDTVVASVEVVNCKSIKVQVHGQVPTMLIDKTDGAGIYLSKTSLHTTIVSSKSSEMNVSVPVGEEDELKEMPIPEQFVTVYDPKSGKIKTESNAHLG